VGHVLLTTSSRAVGAVGVTIPSCWYLLSNAPEPAHGHGDHGDSHGKEHEEEHEEEPKDEPEEESKDEAEDKEASSETEDKDSEKSEDSDSGDDEKKESGTPDTSDDEGAEDSEAKDEGNTKKQIPDAKGDNKKRIESSNAIKAGEKDNSDDEVRLDNKLNGLFTNYSGCCVQVIWKPELTNWKARRTLQHRYKALY
jgi:hypothetical protein